MPLSYHQIHELFGRRYKNVRQGERNLKYQYRYNFEANTFSVKVPQHAESNRGLVAQDDIRASHDRHTNLPEC